MLNDDGGAGNALACFHVAKQLEYAEQVCVCVCMCMCVFARARACVRVCLSLHMSTRVPISAPRPPQEAAAIEFFGRAGKFNHAVRIAKAQGLDDQLLSLALQVRARVFSRAYLHVCASPVLFCFSSWK